MRRRLLAWFRREKRQLPWRGTSDPYRIWVSEIMLQQTTVAAVLGRYERFLERFPDLRSLARAREETVLAEWSGLGYYARARNLRLAARAIVRDYGGDFPRDPDALARLPGFGAYTSAAVACLAFGARVPAADANVTRVLSRLFAIRGASGSRTHRRQVLAHAAALLPRRRPGDVIAAWMDLGQTVCLPRRPDCGRCPLADLCASRREGRCESYPRRAVRPRPVAVHLAAALVEIDGRALLLRGRSPLLDGLWQFPSGEGPRACDARASLVARLSRLGLRLASPSPRGRTRHTMVHRRLTISIFGAVPRAWVSGHTSWSGPSVAASRWFRPGELARAAIPTLTRRIAIAAGFLPAREGQHGVENARLAIS